jgi:predicted enzyme related to lactoylglutathione lyase
MSKTCSAVIVYHNICGPILTAIGETVVSMTITLQRTYPHGVPSWVDTSQQDPQAAQEFYAGLFGWSFTTVSPPGAPVYAIASLDGRDVVGLGQAQDSPPSWNTYIAVDDAEQTAARLTAAGAEITDPGQAGPFGRAVNLRDPTGVPFRLWQAGEHQGAQLVNDPGSWNFSDLHTDEPGSIAFSADVFGWSIEDLGFATMVRRPGYGDHLEATVDPTIRQRQAGVDIPQGFEDAIAWVAPLEPRMAPHWHVSFSVADRDAAAERAERLGGEVLSTQETYWTRTALVRDPQGAVLTASQFTPPD